MLRRAKRAKLIYKGSISADDSQDLYESHLFLYLYDFVYENMIFFCNYRKYCKSDTKKIGHAGEKVLTEACTNNTIFCKKCKK